MMEYYKISKKTMKCIGTVLNKPDKMHDARVFYIPIYIWDIWNLNGHVMPKESIYKLDA